jgi:hypothetical protein
MWEFHLFSKLIEYQAHITVESTPVICVYSFHVFGFSAMEIQTTNEDKSVMEWEKIVPERYKLMLKLEKQPILNMIPNTPFISFNPPSYEGKDPIRTKSTE